MSQNRRPLRLYRIRNWTNGIIAPSVRAVRWRLAAWGAWCISCSCSVWVLYWPVWDGWRLLTCWHWTSPMWRRLSTWMTVCSRRKKLKWKMKREIRPPRWWPMRISTMWRISWKQRGWSNISRCLSSTVRFPTLMKKSVQVPMNYQRTLTIAHWWRKWISTLERP